MGPFCAFARPTHDSQSPFDLGDFVLVHCIKVETEHLGAESRVERLVRDVLEWRRRRCVEIGLDGRIRQLCAGHAVNGDHDGVELSSGVGDRSLALSGRLHCSSGHVEQPHICDWVEMPRPDSASDDPIS